MRWRMLLVWGKKGDRHMKEFSYDIFRQIVNDKGTENALAYKELLMPNSLYKFFKLDGEHDESILNNLENSRIFLNSYKEVNDPFDSRPFIYDYEKIDKNNYSKEEFDKIVDMFRGNYLFLCFSFFNDDLFECMPMWAHYANNGKGFCVKYKINCKGFVYPINYVYLSIENWSTY